VEAPHTIFGIHRVVYLPVYQLRFKIPLILLDDLDQECKLIVKDFKLFWQLVDFANAHRYAFVCCHNVDDYVDEEKMERKRVAGNRKCFILPKS
jgi:hypothetical protein